MHAILGDYECTYENEKLVIEKDMNTVRMMPVRLLSYTDFIDTCMDIIEKQGGKSM